MLQLTFIILDDNDLAEKALKELDAKGFNGTVVPSTSLKHALKDNKEMPLFISLSHLDSSEYANNTCMFILAEKERAKEISTIIRSLTDDFKKCKGAIISLPVEYYEGSFHE